MTVTNTSEYALATTEAQRRASGHKNNFISSEEAANKVGLDTKNRTVSVMCSDGKEHDIAVNINYYSITPTPAYKKSGVNEKGLHVAAWMIKGGSPTAKNAIFFTANDITRSSSFKELKAEIDEAFRKFKKQHEDDMKADLAASHSPKGKKAMKELKKIADESGTKGLYDWFKKHDFKMDHIKEEDLKPLANSIIKDNQILNTWISTTTGNQYGHAEGTAIRIDWHNHTITYHGWDSGD